MHILREKLEDPDFAGLVKRPRLQELLRSLWNNSRRHSFPVGRERGRRIGLGVAPSHTSTSRGIRSNLRIRWNVFAQLLCDRGLAGGQEQGEARSRFCRRISTRRQSSIATTLIHVFAEAETELLHEPLVIVLDGIHHLFDAPWFGEFFTLLLSSLPEIRICFFFAEQAADPLWRLRSKQQLTSSTKNCSRSTRENADCS